MPTVCFAHDLGDRRVWQRLIGVLPLRVRAIVVEQPPTGRLAPARVAEHIEASARPLLPETGVDLVVGAGIAARAAAELAADGTAAHALLVDPDTAVLVGHPDFRMPEPGEETADFLLAMAPFDERFRETGMLSEEGIAVMVDHSVGRNTSLDEQDRDLLRGIASKRLTEAMPLDISDALSGEAEGPDWFARLRAAPERFTVYSGDLPALGDPLRTVLAHDAPQTRVVQGSTRTAYPWLEAPEALGTLIVERLGP
ncbi:hypothetical protein [Nocardiopsis baichengensis]|uniref:hypothetical protein n=1 Tax=Nocardiopsis baichengensis TaxID=280240 RepID=UPI0003796682|nr:hypothetical protein [Nocardiopsis baichengensis]